MLVFLGVHISVFMALHAQVGGNTEVYGKDQPLLKKSHLQIRALPVLILLVRCMHLPMFTVTIYFSNLYSIDVTEPLILLKHFTSFNTIMSFICL